MNSTSISICSLPWTPLPLDHIIPRFFVIFIGIFSNILLVIGIIMDPLKCLRNSSSCLIMNLAITDILTCFNSLLVLYWSPCVNGLFVYPMVLIPYYMAITSIIVMASDRYMSCVHPFKYRVIITRKVTLALIVAQWLLVVGILASQTWLRMSWGKYLRIGLALLVLNSAAILYAKATYVLRRNSRYLESAADLSSSIRDRTHHARLVNEKRLLTTVFLVSFVTVTTLGPTFIYKSFSGKTNLYNENFDDSRRDEYQTWIATLNHVNFAVNPLIYAWRLKNYRETMRAVIRKLRKCGKA